MGVTENTSTMIDNSQIALSILQIVGLVLPVTLISARFYIDLVEDHTGGRAIEKTKLGKFIQRLILLITLLIVSAVLAISYLLVHADLNNILIISLAVLGIAFGYFMLLLKSMREEVKLDFV
jgi:hypothetical protein